jgi:hypothetical protein
MKYTVEMGSGAMIYTCTYKVSYIQRLIGRNTQTHRQYGDLISIILLFKIRTVG